MKMKNLRFTLKNKWLSFFLDIILRLVLLSAVVILLIIIIPTCTPRPVFKMVRAEADIAAIENAIAMYENDTGKYPENSHSDWVSIDVLIWRLTGKQPNASIPDSDITGDSKWHGPYIKDIEKDPCGEYYYYTNNRSDIDGTNKQVGFLIGDKVPELPYYIYSKGKDKLTGLGHNADDINSWDENKLWRDSY
ncbi:MAG: type II secretion system protein GspG [Candidatus Omnitrophica bacterium]|nr:type II secretion system protein GspG [Candidatus Omnitrophota bacterium]MBU1048075.1 type II secretion system protein GspG [Candidatus Omnitrophota bacterium]MBU1889445.1 type II secretion system protein GspG [Candidatus Omnitrophota bacterium]